MYREVKGSVQIHTLITGLVVVWTWYWVQDSVLTIVTNKPNTSAVFE